MICSRIFHHECVKVAGLLCGDAAFEFKCRNCNGEVEEICRDNLPWIPIIKIAMYYLGKKQGTQSILKYDIAKFIEDRWEYFKPGTEGPFLLI
jgi:hypothetical protein